MSSEESVQNAILSALTTAFKEPIIEQSIPDSKLVRRNAAGDIDPYYAVEFGDLQEGYTHSMAGPRGDDYVMPVYIRSVAPTASIARRMANRVRDLLLGEAFTWTGSIRKRPGGGMFPITASNGATEAFISPASFGVPIQFDANW